MMQTDNFFRINYITEDNFTQIILDAGGRKFSEDYSKEKELNADYVLFDSLIELKNIEETGLDKKTRQLKIADIFDKYNHDYPVIVVDPKILNQHDLRSYNNIMEGLIKTHVKKASNQLKVSNADKNKELQVLILLNNGYAALDHFEFKDLAEKCAKNDSSNIDYLITCGIYYYSDGFDSYFIAPFKLSAIKNKKEFTGYEKLSAAWSSFVNDFMTDVVKGVALQKLSKLPVLDFSFSVGDKTYIKPSPPFGEASKFYVNGRPRINTSGIESCPPVGLTYSKISHASWDFITKKFNSLWDKGGTYSEWLNYEEYAKKNNKSTVVCPFIEIEVTKKQVECAYKETEYLDFYKLSSMAAINFDKAVRAIFKKAVKLESIKKLPSKYLYLTVREVGRDKTMIHLRFSSKRVMAIFLFSKTNEFFCYMG